MVQSQLHRDHLLAVATDPQKMGAIKEPLGQALGAALAPDDLDVEKIGVLIGATDRDGALQLVTEVVELSADSPTVRPLLITLHLLSQTIFDLVRNAAPEDEAAFDQATSVARELLGKHNIDPLLDVILVETAIAAIHAEASAGALVITLYSDGRLLALKGSLLSRLLQDYQYSLQRRATTAK